MPKPLKPCGTWAAYVRHRRHHEPIDNDCRRARNRYEQQRATLAELIHVLACAMGVGKGEPC